MPHNERFFEELAVNFHDMAVFLDADGTLLPDGEREVSDAARAKVGELKKSNRVCLCINARTSERNEELARSLGVPLLTRRFRKPSAKILCEVPEESRRAERVVIGDKMLVDGVFALRIGARFIRVRRKQSGNERFPVRAADAFDDCVWSMAKKLFS
ncbi:MAG: hypothetical protein AAB699_00665 [Patescibacteria group bacterium]